MESNNNFRRTEHRSYQDDKLRKSREERVRAEMERLKFESGKEPFKITVMPGDLHTMFLDGNDRWGVLLGFNHKLDKEYLHARLTEMVIRIRKGVPIEFDEDDL